MANNQRRVRLAIPKFPRNAIHDCRGACEVEPLVKLRRYAQFSDFEGLLHPLGRTGQYCPPLNPVITNMCANQRAASAAVETPEATLCKASSSGSLMTGVP